MSWKDKVVGDGDVSAPRMVLQYYAPSVVNEKVVVQPPEEVVSLGNEKWKDCVVGHFIDRNMAFKSVRFIAERIWAKFGLVDVLSNDEGFFFFQFDKVGAFREVIEAGPWHFGGKLMVLKQWQPHMSLVKEQVNRIPIWAQLYNVPLDLWTTTGLSYVASALGKPLYADRMTESCKRLNYAKICVEVDVNSELPNSFDVLADGDKFSIKVWYPSKPLKCGKCKVFGHRPCQTEAVHNLKPNPKQTWMVKTVTKVPEMIVSNEQAQEVFDQAIVNVTEDILGDDGHKEIVVSGSKVSSGSKNLRSDSIFEPGENSDPNKFAILQSCIESEGNGDAGLLPFEAEFHAGLIETVEAIEVPPTKKGRARGKTKK